MSWPLSIDGHDYQPVPDSWIANGIDDRDGDGPQLLAVSVAQWRDGLRVRYAHPYGTRVGQLLEPAHPEGEYPARLADGTWPRSIAAGRLEPVGDVRLPERQHLAEVWEGRLDGVLPADRRPDDLADERLVADGGTPPIERLIDTDGLRGDPDNPVVQMQAEIHTVLNRYNHLRRTNPGWIAALFIEIADTLRQRHNLEYEVEHLGSDVWFVKLGEMYGWIGAPRDGEYADVDAEALDELLDEDVEVGRDV